VLPLLATETEALSQANLAKPVVPDGVIGVIVALPALPEA